MAGVTDYFELLRRWNSRIRLTGSTDQVALEQHAEEARTLLPHLPEVGRLVDVGSGGGFPGVLLALWRPDLVITLVEPLAKKTAFLNTCRRELGLQNVAVFRGRDEDLRAAADFQPFDVATSQATFEPAEWFQRARLLLAPGGIALGMLGPSAENLPTDVILMDAPVGGRELRLGMLRSSA